MDPVGDRPVAAELWAASFEPTWPVLPRALDLLRGGFACERAGDVLGMVAVDDAGSVPLLMVRPDARRRGIGRRLVDAALAQLHAAGVERVGLASGGSGYIWPGVPLDLPGSVAFFARTGWTFGEVVHDMVRSLRGFASPAAAAAVRTELVPDTRRAEAFPFVDANFPNWSRHFRDPDEDVLVARDGRAGIVGALLLQGPAPDGMLAPFLGPDMGTIGCVGVAEPHRGRGVGTAMVAAASAELRDRGVDRCHIGWTTATAFYAGLGYRTWRSYRTGRRVLG